MKINSLKKTKKDHTKPYLARIQTPKCIFAWYKHLVRGFCRCGLAAEVLHTVWVAGERKEHQPALTPTKESKAGAASTPVSPWVPSQMGLVAIFSQEKQIVEKDNINKKKREMSKPFAFFYHSSQSNILYYNNAYSIHILNKKHADFFFFFTFLLSFPKKKTKKGKN